MSATIPTVINNNCSLQILKLLTSQYAFKSTRLTENSGLNLASTYRGMQHHLLRRKCPEVLRAGLQPAMPAACGIKCFQDQTSPFSGVYLTMTWFHKSFC